MKKVDRATAESMELAEPWASSLDARDLHGKVLSGSIFSAIGRTEREAIWTRLSTFKGLIPTLRTFFEDVKLLQVWNDCLRWVVCPGPKETISAALANTYQVEHHSQNSVVIQMNEVTYRLMSADLCSQSDLAYRQLCIFAMRHYKDIPRKPSSKDLLARPAAIAQTSRLRELADLAQRLGFQSSDITALQ